MGLVVFAGLLTPRLAPRAWAGQLEQVAAARAGIQRVDSDGDGRLSRAEHAAAARKMFDAMDANHDGQVAAAEMEASEAHRKDRRPSRSMKALNLKAADKIKLNDRNGDGLLSVDEHIAAAMVAFDKMDRNGDGFLTSAELAAGHATVLRKGRRH